MFSKGVPEEFYIPVKPGLKPQKNTAHSLLTDRTSRLDEKPFKKIKEVYLGETGTLSYSVSLAGG